MWGEAVQNQIFTIPNKVLTIEEIRHVLKTLRDWQTESAMSNTRRFWPELLADETARERATLRNRPSSIVAWQDLITFRLSCCCGLRSKEIRGLRLKDLQLEGKYPILRVRGETSKASAFGPGRSRAVPLWWDQATLEDLRDYEAFLQTRKGPEGEEGNPFVVYPARVGSGVQKPFSRSGIAKKWKTALSALPEHRRLSIHSGRHSFCSHALASGRTLVEVQKAAGHRWVTTTQIYLHALESGTDLPDVFPEEEIDW